jgi:AraC-like DNA-binding protein
LAARRWRTNSPVSSTLRSALRQADPALHTVTEIAYDFGFTHMGRFAGEYRTRYGVPPHETLRG